MTELTITADTLCRAMWGMGADAVQWGCYAGTDIRVRRVPANEVLRIRQDEDGLGISITDSADGWIAERFCHRVVAGKPRLSMRYWRKLPEAGQ